ncbi:MAG TPA: RHS repeat-associated core domain-containing protein, partial [Candidatus Binatus sp.]|nr:RHS repeat-associated core domain-containing protein [Candidatus Binatus sp.]
MVAKVTNLYHSSFPADEQATFDSMISDDICATMHDSDIGNVCADISNNDPTSSGWGGGTADPNNDNEPATLIKPHRRNTSIVPTLKEPTGIGPVKLAQDLLGTSDYADRSLDGADSRTHRHQDQEPADTSSVRNSGLPSGPEPEREQVLGSGSEDQIADTLPVTMSPYRVIGAASAKQFVYSYFHVDHLGSVRLVTDPNGAVISRGKFLPFGEEILGASLARNSHQYTGHERDAETGSDYMRARYFSSAIGRFDSVDPIASLNAFEYVHNNPMAFIDPLGLKADGDSFGFNDGMASMAAEGHNAHTSGF